MLLLVQGFENLKDQYHFTTRPLNIGDLYTIMHAKHRATHMDVAVKVASIQNRNKNSISKLMNEASFLYKCRHPYIVKCLEVF